MTTKEEAKEKIKALIQFYISKKNEFDKTSEDDIRHKLIDKTFRILGWDVYGDEDPTEVQREEGIKNRESKKKKADYVFRLNSVPEFVVEAKAIKGVNMDDEVWKEQSIGYAYNLACSWAVLTNFVKVDIFYVNRDDVSPIRKISDFSNLSVFDENFERLWLLSKESIKNKLLDKEAEKLGIKPTKERVGKQLYADLKDWRSKISNNLKKKYEEKYKDYEIEEIVQKIIDRLIFIRKLEDLEIEERKLDQLIRKFSDHTKYYQELKSLFVYYRNKYNSGLFGEDDKIQEPDLIEIDNEIIRSVIMGMYKPKGGKIEYNFAVIDADVLGNIYEQYLAFILKLKDTSKKTKLEGGKTHRKEQGIYYTPTYIVDYIVNNTLIEYLKHKDLDTILGTKILDPACGSGSFLIRAFSELCKFVEEKLKNGERSQKYHSLKDYSKKLELHQKVTILTNCIYGVDLDRKAVEIAQLNLLLKLLEGETAESLANLKQTRKLLPMLNENIKNGNSLIEDRKIDREHAFRWGEEFRDILKYDEEGNLKEGYGFDIILGNPPYINNRNLPKEQKSFFEKNYATAYQQYDIYVLFYELGLKLLKEEGNLGFITPNKFTITKYGLPLRKLILVNRLLKVIDVSQLNVFEDASTYPYIIIIKKAKPLGNKILFSSPDSPNLTKIEPLLFSQDELNSEESLVFSKNNEESKILGKFKGEFLIDIYRAKPTTKNISEEGDQFVITNREIEKYRILSGNKKIKFKQTWSVKIPAIVMKKICFVPTASLLNLDKYIPVNTVYVIHSKNKSVSLNYLLAILNSKLVGYYARKKYGTTAMRGGFIELRTFEIKNIPIKLPTEEQQKWIIRTVDKIISLNVRLNELIKKKTSEVTRIEEEIKDISNLIDQEVYEIYGITEEEQKIIEEGLAK